MFCIICRKIFQPPAPQCRQGLDAIKNLFRGGQNGCKHAQTNHDGRSMHAFFVTVTSTPCIRSRSANPSASRKRSPGATPSRRAITRSCEIEIVRKMKPRRSGPVEIGGASGNRTHVRGFADLCLTIRPSRQLKLRCSRRLLSLQAAAVIINSMRYSTQPPGNDPVWGFSQCCDLQRIPPHDVLHDSIRRSAEQMLDVSSSSRSCGWTIVLRSVLRAGAQRNSNSKAAQRDDYRILAIRAVSSGSCRMVDASWYVQIPIAPASRISLSTGWVASTTTTPTSG